MGRHRAEPVGKRGGRRAPEPEPRPQAGRAASRPEPPRASRRNPELLGWGLFLTGTAVACLLWADVPAGPAAGSAALLLSAFLIAWFLSATSGTTAARPPAPVPAATGRAHPVAPPAHRAAPPEPAAVAAAPAIPPAPEAVKEFMGLPRPRPVATSLDGPSRWTRTFGPPETGSLPLQPYVPSRRTAVQTADPMGQDRRQRSHSSD